MTPRWKSFGMVLWNNVFAGVAEQYPDVQTRRLNVDAAAMFLVNRPADIDVLVAGNLFGDILSDEAAAIAGGIGLAPGGNVNLDRSAPSMFEPIHGSAPDIAGKGIANPVAAILAAAMLLRHLGSTPAVGTVGAGASDPTTTSSAHAADAIERAVAQVLRDVRVCTPDLAALAITAEVGDAVCGLVRHLATAGQYRS